MLSFHILSSIMTVAISKGSNLFPTTFPNGPSPLFSFNPVLLVSSPPMLDDQNLEALLPVDGHFLCENLSFLVWYKQS
ncbi:hypothetical protein ES332_A05G370100v1 [Gossypium tomentosum]|uniref:Uncharacterized protein n=1 Tax=Gossypium tomentosum TaxID=34277 RepID=A0A5D2QSN0_GOSTO|nr:hypothetical protein ES332_A05G370100v1 [Gossypium tomentosum]